MSNSAERVADQALRLKASERADIAEKLLLSLNLPNSDLDAEWAIEADSRVEAYDRGEIDSVPADQVFAKYKR